MCKHLHLRAVDGRRTLLEESAGVAANPMNQAGLTKIPLASLGGALTEPVGYEPATAFARAVQQICGSALATMFGKDLSAFCDDGLATFSAEQLTRFKDKYGENDTPISREIMRWLVGGFQSSAALTAEFEEFGQHKDPDEGGLSGDTIANHPMMQVTTSDVQATFFGGGLTRYQARHQRSIRRHRRHRLVVCVQTRCLG